MVCLQKYAFSLGCPIVYAISHAFAADSADVGFRFGCRVVYGRTNEVSDAILRCINIRKTTPFLHIYAMMFVRERTKNSLFGTPFQSEKALKSCFLDERKTRLQCLLDAIMLLTFFDAVAIVIATCSYRDSNMMLSTCVHVVIKSATCCQFEGTSF